MLTLAAPRVGHCATCGRQAPGTLMAGSLRECEPPCPRCGSAPFFLDSIGPYTGNVARMTYDQVMDFLVGVDDPAEIEVCFRLELIGHSPNGRQEVLQALYDHYWKLAEFMDPGQRAKILTLDQARAAWRRDLVNPETYRYYVNLVRVPNANYETPSAQTW